MRKFRRYESLECNDKNCPMHGSLRVRGMIVTGKVVSTRMRKSVVVERDLLKPVSKYKRRARTKSKLHAHLPDCIKVNLGDEVEIGQTRKLSKTKAWVVLRVIKKEGKTPIQRKEEIKEESAKEKKQVKKKKEKEEKGE
ncbi:MAG: 30S ribosomal protein S17 [Candidatus Anstonellales archaeon]